MYTAASTCASAVSIPSQQSDVFAPFQSKLKQSNPQEVLSQIDDDALRSDH